MIALHLILLETPCHVYIFLNNKYFDYNHLASITNVQTQTCGAHTTLTCAYEMFVYYAQMFKEDLFERQVLLNCIGNCNENLKDTEMKKYD